MCLQAVLQTNRRPPLGWPDEGKVQLNSYSVRYREGLDLVLKGISLHIDSGEKVGIQAKPALCSLSTNDDCSWCKGAQWLIDSRPRGRGFEPHQCHCVVSLSKNINPSLVLVQPRKTCPFITERLLMGRKESNQTKLQLMPNFRIQ